jgi:serine/threonine-protein kinase
LVDSGDLDHAEAETAVEEARSLEEALAPDLPAGKKLGEFRLVREIGRGGMGIVYEAEQESLGRRVALKVLPAGAALDERLAIRFLREARAAGRLRHPGIVPVYTSGRAEGVLYFAMELIEGRTLAAVIADGALAPTEAARIAAEVARALEHAHAQGLVHRDVKPENILLSREGRARVADFGLVLEASAACLTLSRHALGTPSFIAPEQARGESVDARSDIYSLGAVLYAMLAGVAPYAGDVPSMVLARVLTERPRSLLGVRPGLPPHLVTICERAMAREPAGRYASAGGMAEALERLLERGAVSVETPENVPERPAKRRMAAVAVTAVIVGVLGLLGVSWWNRLEPRAPVGAAFTAKFLPVLQSPGRKAHPSLSADGSWLAYASDVDGDWDVYLLKLPGETPVNLTEDSPENDLSPALAPDGRMIAFQSARPSPAIYVMELPSRKLRRLTERSASDLAWSSDGREILYTDRLAGRPGPSAAPSKLFAVDLASGRSRPLTGIYGAQPQSPSGSGWVAFVSQGEGESDVWTIPRDGGEAAHVTDDDALEWSPVGSAAGTEIYFGSDRDGTLGLFRIDVDRMSGRPTGAPVPVSSAIFPAPFYLASGGIDDAFLTLIGTRHDGRLHRLVLSEAPEASVEGVVALPGRFLAADSPHLSPDGRTLAFTAVTSQEDLAIAGAEGSEPRLLTQDPFRDRAPRWSPDGSRIAFHSDRSGNMEIWTIRPDGSDLVRRTATRGDATHPVWSPDGTRLAFTVHGQGAFLARADGTPDDGAPEPIAPPEDGASPFEPSSWASDGRLLAGTARGVVVYSLAERRYRRLTDHGGSPVWLDDRRLLFTTEREIHLLDSRSGDSRVLFSFLPARLAPSVCAAPDARSLYASLVASDEEVWRVQLRD